MLWGEKMNGINYEMKYAYTEVYEIINWLGEEYKKRVPEKVYKLIKSERRIDYKPNFDFNEPLNKLPLKQETKDLIAYLNYYYWCNDEKRKADIIEKINQNIEKKKKREKEERRKEIAMRAQMSSTVGGAISQGLRNLNN